MILIILIVIAGGLLAAAWLCEPQWIGDQNRFLENFINHEILNVYGVLVAITLANAAQVHLSLNRLEEKRNKSFFDPVRAELKHDAVALVASLCVAVVLLVVKGNVDSALGIAAINAASLWILFLQILVTWDVFSSVLSVAADLKKPSAADEARAKQAQGEANGQNDG